MSFSAVPKSVQRWLRTRSVIGPELTIAPLTSRFPIAPSDWFVDPQNGGDTADGRDPASPLATVAEALDKASSGDTIYVVGNITEEVTGSNLLEDITIVGVANRPRHADHARDIDTYPTYAGVSGAAWRQAASHAASTPLLKIRGQGWRVENILFVPPSDAAAIELERNALSNVSEYDASHFSAKGCRFAGGQSGIEDDGGCFNVHIEECTFHGSTNAIKTLNTAVAVPLAWVVEKCRFFNNTNHIVVSATDWVIKLCTFGRFTTDSINLTLVAGNDAGELANVVTQNLLSGTYSNAGGYRDGGGTTDEWGGNFNSLTGGVTAAQPA